MKILYFGYDLFAPCLEAVLEDKNIEVLKVYSFEPDGIVDFNDRVKELSKKHNIEFTENKITAGELKKQVEQNGAELILCAGYAYRIPIECVSVPAVNIHPSPLPKGRGPWPMPWAILNGEKNWAVTAHKLAEKIDEGDILLQKSFELSLDETYETLEKKISSCAELLVRALLLDFKEYWQSAQKQGNGEYLHEPSDVMRTVYADTPIEKIAIIERAFPQNYVIYKNEKEGK